MVLVGHDHDVAVPQRLGAVVRRAVAQTENLLDVRDLGVVHDLVVRRVAHVQELAAQREDAVAVAADHGEAGDGERLGGVALGEDQSAVLGVAPAGVVGVVQLGNAGEPRLLGAILLLELLALLERGPGQDLLHHSAAHHLLDARVARRVLGPEVARARVERLLGLRVKRRVLDERVDEYPEVVLDVRRLEVLAALLLLLDLLQQLRGHLEAICHRLQYDIDHAV